MIKIKLENLLKIKAILNICSSFLTILFFIFLIKAFIFSSDTEDFKFDYTINLNANENIAKALQYAYLVNNRNISKTCVEGCYYSFMNINDNDTSVISINDFRKQDCLTYCYNE